MRSLVGTGITRRRPALSLVETSVSMLIVGLMLVAALNTVGAARVGQQHMTDRSRAVMLAQELMAEILQQHYADPAFGFGSFGLAAEEAAPGNRSLFEDVDDYDGWSASPPQYKDGTKMDDLAEWKRSVNVDWVDPTDLTTVVGSDQGAKRIEVTVSKNGADLATATSISIYLEEEQP